MSRKRRWETLTLAGVLCATGLAAQAPPASQVRLANAKSLKCSFPTMATGTWTDGEPQAALKPAKLSVAFTAVDTQDGTADAVGDQGKAYITVRVVGAYLHFMQMDP